MKVIDQNTEPTIRIDFDNLYGQSEDDFENRWVFDGVDTGVGLGVQIRAHWEANFKRTQAHIFETKDDEVVASAPLLIMQIYKQNPSTIAQDDVVAQVNNLVFFDYQYLRMSVDNEYAIQYKNKWNQEQVNHELLKPVMIVVGIGMFVAGAYMAIHGQIGSGITTALFGVDIVGSNLFEVSIINEALKIPLAAFFRATGRDTAFMYERGFSVFQFTSDHATNLILTQLTFMLIGAVCSAGGGLRESLKEAATHRLRVAATNFGAGASAVEEIQVTSAVNAIRYLLYKWAPRLSSQHMLILSKYLEGQFMHLVTGTVFLFTLGAIGSAFGDGGLFAEVTLQMLLLASIVLGTYHTVKVSGMSEAERGTYLSEMKRIKYLASKDPWTKRSWSLLQPLARIKYISILEGSGALSILLALDIASKVLQFATIIGTAF